MNRYVCASIEYASEPGVSGTDVHSDVCPPGCLPANLGSAQWREFIHSALDSWLDNSDGTGHFVIGGSEFWDAFNDD